MSETISTPPAVEKQADFATAKEPPKRWFNWWRVNDPDFLTTRGEVWPGTRCWPSKDAAETSAAQSMSENARRAAFMGQTPPDYLGAFPEGDRP